MYMGIQFAIGGSDNVIKIEIETRLEELGVLQEIKELKGTVIITVFEGQVKANFPNGCPEEVKTKVSQALALP